jgi:hypothetical protein
MTRRAWTFYPELAPAAGEHVIKKHRYSGFFGTDLDIILREWGSRYRQRLGDDYRELLPRHGAGRDVSQLPRRLSVGRDRHL